MKAAIVCNIDGTATLLHGLEVEQFPDEQAALNHCSENEIAVRRTYKMKNPR